MYNWSMSFSSFVSALNLDAEMIRKQELRGMKMGRILAKSLKNQDMPEDRREMAIKTGLQKYQLMERMNDLLFATEEQDIDFAYRQVKSCMTNDSTTMGRFCVQNQIQVAYLVDRGVVTARSLVKEKHCQPSIGSEREMLDQLLEELDYQQLPFWKVGDWVWIPKFQDQYFIPYHDDLVYAWLFPELSWKDTDSAKMLVGFCHDRDDREYVPLERHLLEALKSRVDIDLERGYQQTLDIVEQEFTHFHQTIHRMAPAVSEPFSTLWLWMVDQEQEREWNNSEMSWEEWCQDYNARYPDSPIDGEEMARWEA